MTAIAVIIILAMGLAIPSGIASVSARTSTCASAKKMDSDVPVLAIHGWMGKPDIWRGKNSIAEAIESLPNVFFERPFSYEANNLLDWVDNPAIADKLAETISCLAATSRAGGGLGKVILLAHSMGGLASRLASKQVGQYIGGVITLGTPNKGSGKATAGKVLLEALCAVAKLPGFLCVPAALDGLSLNSNRLKALPPWPQDIPVLAIASRMSLRVTVPTLFGPSILQYDAGGDDTVGVDSATQGAAHPELGGGAKVFPCHEDFFASKAPACEHGTMMNYPPIQQEVVRSIKRYLAFLSGNTVDFAGLNLSIPSSWKTTKRRSDSIMIENKQHCEIRKPLHASSRSWCPWFMIYKVDTNSTYDWGNITCDNSPEADVKLRKTVSTIGGIRAQKYVIACPFDSKKYAFRVWQVPSKGWRMPLGTNLSQKTHPEPSIRKTAIARGVLMPIAIFAYLHLYMSTTETVQHLSPPRYLHRNPPSRQNKP
jgi:pimeloyl-ACP methyl ester carboxylesterase